MKVAISLPDPVFHAAERLAATLRKPRSRLYAEALAAYVGAHAASDVTERLNALHGQTPMPVDPALAAAQRRILADEAW